MQKEYEKLGLSMLFKYSMYNKKVDELDQGELTKRGDKNRAGECENGSKFHQNFTTPLRVHAGPPVFGSFHNRPYEPLDIQRLRTEFAKGAKSLPKHRHMGPFDHSKLKSHTSSPRTPNLASEVAGLEDLDSQVVGLEAYEGLNRQGKWTERDDEENPSENERTRDETTEGIHDGRTNGCCERLIGDATR